MLQRQAQRFQDELDERSMPSIFHPIYPETFELASIKTVLASER
jgi:hypothetical protein